MPCHAIRKWTFIGLVGAFLDLSITFLLLCSSSLAYFASKFLGLFGLNLPCSCNGFFGIPNNTKNNTCFQRELLVDFPAKKISSVQSSVKTKFPFDCPNSNLEIERDNDTNEGVGSEGEASCISSSERRSKNINKDGDLAKVKGQGFVMGAMNFPDIKDGRFEFKGKWVTRHKSRNGLRRRRKGGTVIDHRGKLSWVPSDKSFWSDNAEIRSAPGSINFEDRKEALVDIGSKRKFSHGFEWNESVNENERGDENASLVDDFNSYGDQDLDGNAKNTIRLLEQALEEEHAARAVLYIELEKERSAAASAADEAMAMILRLQKEKAVIEMEARQCQRILEEKYEYDAEEMNILKEILVRREREKYFLEKEVEAYRQMISGNEQFEADMYCMIDDNSVMLKQNSAYIDQEDKVEKPNSKESLPNTKLSEGDNKDPPHNLQQNNKESECEVHDVHVIDDQFSVYKKVMGDKSNTKTSSNNPSIPTGLPPIGNLKSRRSSDMRRKSMSAFDAERFKIDNEITWLREKLKSVQEGREKLKLTKGNKEREKLELQILEDITSQLQEIRQLTEPGKAARRASLPPLTSNVMSKKRRWRSGPMLLDGST
ncbi:hypothetical protein JCGZ_01127 [Jatropha curcas]|uniref:GTD-binding domain-containing protein n=1 Tax=Jatropha curcas TaxID=180498 RepID=A0A067L4E3_JATCU|nr:myosin-binding protein 3-like [Jatropha curcas]KDP39370.1 hypothetical protein JCGZ_01127 [Jatropha curcas]